MAYQNDNDKCYYNKYIKYKHKYLELSLVLQTAGHTFVNWDSNNFESLSPYHFYDIHIELRDMYIDCIQDIQSDLIFNTCVNNIENVRNCMIHIIILCKSVCETIMSNIHPKHPVQTDVLDGCLDKVLPELKKRKTKSLPTSDKNLKNLCDTFIHIYICPFLEINFVDMNESRLDFVKANHLIIDDRKKSDEQFVPLFPSVVEVTYENATFTRITLAKMQGLMERYYDFIDWDKTSIFDIDKSATTDSVTNTHSCFPHSHEIEEAYNSWISTYLDIILYSHFKSCQKQHLQVSMKNMYDKMFETIQLCKCCCEKIVNNHYAPDTQTKLGGEKYETLYNSIFERTDAPIVKNSRMDLNTENKTTLKNLLQGSDNIDAGNIDALSIICTIFISVYLHPRININFEGMNNYHTKDYQTQNPIDDRISNEFVPLFPALKTYEKPTWTTAVKMAGLDSKYTMSEWFS